MFGTERQEPIFIINWVSGRFYSWLANIGQAADKVCAGLEENVDKKQFSRHLSELPSFYSNDLMGGI